MAFVKGPGSAARSPVLKWKKRAPVAEAAE
jgi:hypothetical protein